MYLRSLIASCAAATLCTGLLVTAPAGAQSIVDSWSTVAVPTAPPLKAVSVDPKTTALLVLDILPTNCGAEHPRCVASIPHIASLVAAARAKGMLVVYSAYPPNDPAIATLAPVKPLGNEPMVVARADKFNGTALDATLKAKGITTVIVTGSSAHGAVLYTGSEAALHGYAVVVPVDCMSSDNPYSEQSVAYQFTVAPTISSHVTLTTSSQIGYAPAP